MLKPNTIGLLLAAGLGTRFDPTGKQDKLLANLPTGKPVLWHSAQALIRAMPNSVAVVQPHQVERQRLLSELGFTLCIHAQASKGMGSSLAGAMQMVSQKQPTCVGVVITLADMPWLPTEAIQAVDAGLKASISASRLAGLGQEAPPYVATAVAGKRGHPVGFGQAWFAALQRLQGDVGAKALLHEGNWLQVPWADERVLRDVDVPQDINPTA